jgi:hypothetical protein
MFRKIRNLVSCLLLLLYCVGLIHAQTTSFSYQGRLTDGDTAANGNYDLQFTLWDAASGGTQQPQPSPITVTRTSVAVANGIFTVQLDFGAGVFPGADRFLEIGVRLAGGGPFTILSPRQQTTATPYAIRSANATTADSATTATTATNATQLNGVAASQYVVTGDSRLTDSRAPTAGSVNYVQNQTSSPQAGANFNISGNGTAGGTVSASVVNAAAQYNIGGSRVLTLGTGVDNLFVGDLAGQANPTGGANSFFGKAAGFNTSSGADNSFFGRSAGFSNTTGFSNSFFGVQAGRDNSGGLGNSFFGRVAGISSLGSYNSFFGYRAGFSNKSAGYNSFFGALAGENNVTGSTNAFFGPAAGPANTTGDDNSFFGLYAGISNSEGSANTAIGAYTRFNSGALDHATVIGAEAMVTASNRVQIGRIAVDTVAIGAFASPTSSIPVCINNLGVFVNCTSSSLRYKERVVTWRQGLNVIQQLRPVTFAWKDGHLPDLGLIAEEVAAVEPLLSTRNATGEIEGVRYDRLNVVLINAIKQQQYQIEELRREVQQLRIASRRQNRRAFNRRRA